MKGLSLSLFIFLLVLCACFCLNVAQAETNTVLNINVSSNQVVTQEVKITPGFAAIIEVPSELLSLAIADQNSFACNKMPPENNKVLCKPLVADKNFTTNLIISTEHNEFNLILVIDELGKTNYFKYVFHDRLAPKDKSLAIQSEASEKPRSNSNLMDNLLNNFQISKCSNRAETEFAVLKCLEKITIGTETYLRFQISSKSHSAFHIVKCSVVLQTLGGFTGLTLKNEAPVETAYVLKTQDLHFGELTNGVAKLSKVNAGKDQRIVFSVFTDLGQEGDLVLLDI